MSAIDTIKVLDHGYVRLIDSMGSDLSVVRAARVSYDAAWRAGEDQGSDKRLINYLWRNKHTSPFEAVTFTFEVKAPIFVFRQWHRHRTWSFNEVSARYAELPEEFYVPAPEMIGAQSASNKQCRDLVQLSEKEKAERIDQLTLYRHYCEDSFQLYRDNIMRGWPRELARMVLPVATYSHMFATVDLLNLMKFLQLRDHEHAQHEIRVYAQAMHSLAYDIVPECMRAFSQQEAVKS
jgi:thymidylate synthase (FAD)